MVGRVGYIAPEVSARYKVQAQVGEAKVHRVEEGKRPVSGGNWEAVGDEALFLAAVIVLEVGRCAGVVNVHLGWRREKKKTV